eukprot:6854762-Pyramimonas_sp.AAC.1
MDRKLGEQSYPAFAWRLAASQAWSLEPKWLRSATGLRSSSVWGHETRERCAGMGGGRRM